MTSTVNTSISNSVWDDLVGQGDLVVSLRQAVAGAAAVVAGGSSSAMTHAWLFTGPPGSGRSNAARAFAAALLCERQGCGECLACRTALSGAHADVTLVVSDQSQLKVDPMRELVRQAALAPSGRRWQIFVIEDADRLNDRAADALLKSLEEPPPRTVWLLCAPTVEDVLPTIRSRCRTEVLRTPPPEAVAAHLVAHDAVSEAVASYAARASQGHIGRARALALDEPTRNRRREVLRIPSQLLDLGSCMTCASNLVEAATEEGEPRAAALDAKDVADLETAYGTGTRGGRSAGYAPALKELQRNQKQRTKRFVRDALDRSLLDLASFYRDVLAVQLGAGHHLINEEQRVEVSSIARHTTGEVSAARLAAIFATREALEGEVAPALALESLMISLGGGVA
ncbi:MAG: polymerase subunit delta [Actinomycetota bacterium]|nr:polymerase subunit delta [Actinomycetota bacterium]